MPDFPVLVGWRLEEREKHLLRFWTESLAAGRLQRLEPGEGPPETNSALYLLSRPSERAIQDLLSWFVPVLAVTGSAGPLPPALLDLGVCATVSLPTAGMPLFLPPLELPPISSACFVVSDSPLFRLRLRQILRFAGREARMDFSSTDDIITILASVEEWPELILLDLDSKRVDTVSFFYRLEKILRDRPYMRARNQMMICKDFSAPGFDLVQVRPLLAPHAKRIFHPAEALLALLETMIFQPWSAPARAFESPRDLRQMLYGEDNAPPGRSPLAYVEEITGQSDVIRRSMPFLALAAHIQKDGVGLAIR